MELKKMPQVPQVDRNLKNRAIMKYLEEEEKLVERSLKMAQERLDQEKEWNEVRVQKESSIDNEIRAHLQKREEELIKRIKEMEADNKRQVSNHWKRKYNSILKPRLNLTMKLANIFIRELSV